MTASRRAFLTGLTAASYSRVMGANDRVQVGFIGYGLIGAQHVFDFGNQRDVDRAAMCDVYQPRLEQGVQACGGKAKPYRDFRKMLENKDLQAIVVSTPDHWHCLAAMMACAAGKDVYVEKPLSVFIREGRWLAQVAKKNNRVVQVGTQQRSGRHYQKAQGTDSVGIYRRRSFSARMARSVTSCRVSARRLTAPRLLISTTTCGSGLRPRRPYNPQRGIYHFRWFWDYSGGQMTNLGAHEIDIVQWYKGVNGPLKVSSFGGRFSLPGPGETPDTQDAIFEYPGKMTMSYSFKEASRGTGAGSMLEFFGTKGSLQISRAGLIVNSDMKMDPNNAIPNFKGQTAGGPPRSDTKPDALD